MKYDESIIRYQFGRGLGFSSLLVSLVDSSVRFMFLLQVSDSDSMSQHHNIASSTKSIHSSTVLKQNQRHEGSGRIIKSILTNRDLRQSQSSRAYSERQIQTSNLEKEKQPARPVHVQLILKGTDGAPENRSIVHGLHVSSERQERRFRHRDKPDRGVWTSRSNVGDESLSPSASSHVDPLEVLSAAGGIRVNKPEIHSGVVVVVAVIILVGLFSVQHYGTDKVGWLFAPIVLVWFLLIGGIGIYNIWRFGGRVLKAFSPLYVYRYIRNGRKESWLSLGGILLSITGTEALFADLANFPVSSVQIAFTLLVFPCLLLAYSGQAAYLVHNLHHSQDVFYRSIPEKIYWPVFVIATLAAIVASQATITATFSIIKQALAHGCFPRVKVVHTSKKFLGQIYIPDINWILMVLCIAVTAGFKNQSQIGNAYGEASAGSTFW
ncbi:potassium transporter 10-like [Vicia villosa]|uniref:potassium transporter 10-like n=1 Tax=Vicia villosa TaxID=3911 RepID=UPI00273A94A1|nr:potassium transporter 10-like [Vicia villosa]